MRLRSVTPLLVAALLSAQELPTLRVTTRVVEVNVIVHDGHGPVAGLTKEDFTLLDKGKPQTITGFSTTSIASTRKPNEPLSPNLFTNRPEARGEAPVNATVVLLDALNTPIHDQQYAREHVLRFLKQLRPQDRVAVYTLGTRLRVLNDFTNDMSRLAASVKRYGGQTLGAAEASSPDTADTGDRVTDAMLNDGLEAIAAAATTNRALTTAAALVAIAHHIGGLPGRKSLVWVSGGFPFMIGYDRPPAVGRIAPPPEQRHFDEEIKVAARALNDAGIAVYPVDASGLLVGPKSMTAAGGSVTRAAAMRGTSNSTMFLPPGRDTMIAIAEGTGGRAFYNTNDLHGAIQTALEDSAITYTLTFTPDAATLDGTYHDLKVHVNRKGVEVRARKTYLAAPDAAPSAQDLSAGVLNALRSPLESTALGLMAGAVRPRPGAIELTVAIEPGGIAVHPQGDKWSVSVELSFGQRGDDGSDLGLVQQPLLLTMGRANYETLMKDGLSVTKTLDLAADAAQVRVVVSDRYSGRIGSLIVPVAARVVPAAGKK